MHNVIRKRIRHKQDGVHVVADIDAAIAINTGADGKASRTVVHSSHTAVQGAAGDHAGPDASSPPSDDPPKEKP